MIAMMRPSSAAWRLPWLGFSLAPLCLLLALPEQPKPTGAFPEVRGLFKAQCVSCHTAKDPSGGLDLETLAGIKKGGKNGALVIPGNPEKSLLLRRIHGLDGLPRMPMGFKPMTTAQIGTITAWIQSGAKFEAKETTHWAYRSPVRPAVPAWPPGPSGQTATGFPRTPIDNFVWTRLAKEGLQPSPEAPPETLVRRLYLDLIGIPPTPEQLDRYLLDKGQDRYEKLVDRLLASPQYGERQAQKWLDLARYADTDGFEKDSNRTAWKYRDWVIDAYNRNLPYDQFTIEQIAGDLLPKATLDQKIATGFQRNTMLNLEGGVDKAEGMYDVIVDRVGTTSSVFLGATMACARCHDHKYDPFSQKDFYSLFAFFANNKFEPRGNDSVSEQKYWEPELRAPSPEQQGLIDALKLEIRDAAGDEKKLAAAKARLARVESQLPIALVLEERPRTTPLATKQRAKGAFTGDGPLVPADTPKILPPLSSKDPDRRDLARWIVRKDNPLTARVEVNRMWEQHFGRGLVETSEDFGTQGSRPSHPELLDWLAVEFMDRNWDLKAMHRLIVTSATYRQSSRAEAKRFAKDPNNVLLARGPRFRLDAETLRDNALAIGGILSLKVGGPSVFPVQPDGIWDSPYSGERWMESKGEDKYRRGLYTFWKRTATYPTFMAFDATSRESCTVRRVRTNTPLQALAMLNDPVSMEAARGLADRMERAGELDTQLAFGFRVATARMPNPDEITRLKRAYEGLLDRYAKDPEQSKKLAPTPQKAALILTANVILNLDETLSLN